MGSISGLRDNLKGAKLPFVTTAAPRRDMETAGKLVKRFTNGMSSNRYFENNYQDFEVLKREINRRGNRQIEKIRQIERARKQNRDINALKQHKLAWRKYYDKLCSSVAKLEDEIMDDVYNSLNEADAHIPVCEKGESPFRELVEYKQLLGEDTRQMRANVLADIAELRNEIDNLFYHQTGAEDENFEILEQKMEVLKNMLSEIDEDLTGEIFSLEVDLIDLAEQDNGAVLKHASHAVHEFEGIPLDLLIADFAHDELWSSLMAELVLLDESFKQRLRELDIEYLHVVGDVNNGWYLEDHMLFEMVRDQYQAHDTQNSHSLFLDRIKRHFPAISTELLLNHNKWCHDRKAFQMKRGGLLKTWQQSKHQLVLKVSALLAEAAQRTEEAYKTHSEKEAQIKYCRQLMDKVNAWKLAKFEEQKLQEELEAMQVQREREKVQEKMKREKSVREEQRNQIQNFRTAKSIMKDEAERLKMEKLREIQENLAKQAVIDQQRIQYRREEREKRLEKLALEKQKREMERERILSKLEELRNQVRVEAIRDPERTLKATVASDARTAGFLNQTETCYEPVNKELFTVNTFNENKLKKDNRVRVENALRSAGLLNTDYARNIIQSMHPPQAPRKDTFSNIKFAND